MRFDKSCLIMDKKAMCKTIFRAAFAGTVDDVRFFIEQGVNVNARNDNDLGRTPLHYAAGGYSSVDVLEYLVAKGAVVNVDDIFGMTPLHCVICGTADIDKLKYLIEKGAKLDGFGMGMTPLQLAANGNSNVEIAKYLVEQGADVHVKSDIREGWTPLHYAASGNHNAKVVKYLIEAGANVNVKSDTGKTPFDVVAISKKKKKEILRAAGGKSGEEL